MHAAIKVYKQCIYNTHFYVNLGSTLATENVNIAMFAAITTTVIVVGMAVILGLVLLFISKNKLKMLFEIQPLNNEMQRLL